MWLRIPPLIPKWLCGIIFMSVSIASMRDTANTLAITPEVVAAIAIATVK